MRMCACVCGGVGGGWGLWVTVSSRVWRYWGRNFCWTRLFCSEMLWTVLPEGRGANRLWPWLGIVRWGGSDDVGGFFQAVFRFFTQVEVAILEWKYTPCLGMSCTRNLEVDTSINEMTWHKIWGQTFELHLKTYKLKFMCVCVCWLLFRLCKCCLFMSNCVKLDLICDIMLVTTLMYVFAVHVYCSVIASRQWRINKWLCAKDTDHMTPTGVCVCVCVRGILWELKLARC